MGRTSSLKFGILTISDRCSSGQTEDKSGPVIKELLKDLFPSAHILKTCVPDETNEIQDKIKFWVDKDKVDLIITSGGTGMSPRDVTPEAMQQILDQRLPVLEHIIQTEASKMTTLALLSRTTCGIRNKTLVLCFPGSAKAVKENFQIVKTFLPASLQKLQTLK